jgi:ssDNA-binding Zn-finger/Zn-ribbon topoisomerase 1
MLKIKPCPFCGKPGVIYKWHDNLFAVICSNPRCGCEAPNDSKSENGAIRIWNRRRYPSIEE